MVNDRKCDFDGNPGRYPEDQDAVASQNPRRKTQSNRGVPTGVAGSVFAAAPINSKRIR